MKINRQNNGFSQSKLAEMIGSATNYISMIESGKKFPSVKMLEHIAAALNIDTLELFSIASSKKDYIKATKTGILDDISAVVSTRMNELELKL
jgi:transcriptional regulator with XRE-family HTH domain